MFHFLYFVIVGIGYGFTQVSFEDVSLVSVSMILIIRDYLLLSLIVHQFIFRFEVMKLSFKNF